MEMTDARLRGIADMFLHEGSVKAVTPYGKGLINDTFKVVTAEDGAPDYILQRINDAVFRDVAMLQRNIGAVTRHLEKKYREAGCGDVRRHVLHFAETGRGDSYVCCDGTFWRMMVFIPDAVTYQEVTVDNAYKVGLAISGFHSMLADLPEELGETIPHFHDMRFRLEEFRQALAADRASRTASVRDMVDRLLDMGQEMTRAERLYDEGLLPKRVCHCDTKVNNVLFDREGNVTAVIDLDTVMPSFIFSDYGDFLRTAANFVAEDCPDIASVGFNVPVFEAFTRGYLEGAAGFITDLERSMLPFAVKLFPYMQCVRFLGDYINGDTYYKIQYPEHNLVRARNQFALLESICRYDADGAMSRFVESVTEGKK